MLVYGGFGGQTERDSVGISRPIKGGKTEEYKREEGSTEERDEGDRKNINIKYNINILYRKKKMIRSRKVKIIKNVHNRNKKYIWNRRCKLWNGYLGESYITSLKVGYI